VCVGSRIPVGLSKSPVLHHAPTVRFTQSPRELGKAKDTGTPGPDIYDPLTGLKVIKAEAPKYTIGERIKVR
jgi:hypothetical protein